MATEPFDWMSYQVLAKILANRPEEYCQRTAVGRAYYFVFHLARRRVVENGFVVLERVDSHKQVWEKFYGSPEPDCRKLAEIAKNLKLRRERADYEDFYPRVGEDALSAISLADDFANRLARLPKRLPANTGVTK